MNDSINLGGASLAAFLDRLGMPLVARDRVIEIDRILADELASEDPDADGCADLILEAADLISDANPPGFDWSGWNDDVHGFIPFVLGLLTVQPEVCSRVS